MLTTKRNSVKLVSAQEVLELQEQIYSDAQGKTDKALYSDLAILDAQMYFLCVNHNVVRTGDREYFNHDRLRQLAFTSLEGLAEVTIPTQYLHSEQVVKHYPQAGTSKNTTIQERNWLGDVYFCELDLDSPEKKMKMSTVVDPDTGEIVEECKPGLGIYKIVQPKPQMTPSGRPGGITTQFATYEEINIGKAVIAFKAIYRILEDRYNESHGDDPAESFYNQLPTHKCNFVRNLWNALSGNKDFEGNLLSENYRDFVFQYPETLVERIPSTFAHAWKEGCTLLKEVWEAMQKWGRAIPSWRKNNPYPEAEAREWEYAAVDF
jgi:hypothetical protein